MYLKIDTQAIWDEKYLTYINVYMHVNNATIPSLLIITL